MNLGLFSPKFLLFLQVREQWMENGKLSLPSSPLGRWLMAYAERLRTDLFYVVTQLRRKRTDSVFCFSKTV